ncbi:MAG: response regulator transcription factor [Steroidobacteraceae bacterium]|nr:response regulator transcription factor [Steroidobacteraceae bacterium]MCW5571514.1 response regulator transcription factor [Steroidobacteraceae bacterium]
MAEPTVFVVDDDAGVRDALSLLISLRGLRAQVFASAEDFLATYQPQWRGCLLADLQMPGMSGLDLQAELKARGHTLPVIVLTAHGDVATTRAALKNGALDFLEKPVDDAVLIDVLGNAIRIDAERHTAEQARSATAERLARLTPRERDVLRLLARGQQLREIAQQLDISPRTVEVYKARMMEKLGCRTLADVVRIGAELPAGE